MRIIPAMTEASCEYVRANEAWHLKGASHVILRENNSIISTKLPFIPRREIHLLKAVVPFEDALDPSVCFHHYLFVSDKLKDGGYEVPLVGGHKFDSKLGYLLRSASNAVRFW